MPTRVRLTSHHRPSATAAPMAMKASRMIGYWKPGASVAAPSRKDGMPTSGGRRPKIRLTASLLNSSRPKVASTWYR